MASAQRMHSFPWPKIQPWGVPRNICVRQAEGGARGNDCGVTDGWMISRVCSAIWHTQSNLVSRSVSTSSGPHSQPGPFLGQERQVEFSSQFNIDAPRMFECRIGSCLRLCGHGKGLIEFDEPGTRHDLVKHSYDRLEREKRGVEFAAPSSILQM
jgi:hypothetical protein